MSFNKEKIPSSYKKQVINEAIEEVLSQFKEDFFDAGSQIARMGYFIGTILGLGIVLAYGIENIPPDTEYLIEDSQNLYMLIGAMKVIICSHFSGLVTGVSYGIPLGLGYAGISSLWTLNDEVRLALSRLKNKPKIDPYEIYLMKEKTISRLEKILKDKGVIFKKTTQKLGPCKTCGDEETSYQLDSCKCSTNGYCKECINHVLSLITKDSQLLDCPGGCGEKINFLSLERFKAPKEFVEMRKTQHLHQELKKLQDWKFCKTPGCLNGDFSREEPCYQCQSRACLDCGIEHNGECQLEDASLIKVLELGALRPSATPTDEKGRVRPCYHCGKIIERIDGCNIVHCSDCNNSFHWNFGDPKDRDHDFRRDIQHYTPLKMPHF